jgi:hypothetical protein
MDDALHNRQAHSRPFKLFGAVQALEYTEEFVSVGHIEAYAVVFDKIDVLLLLLTTADFDHGHRTPAGKLERVSQEIGQNLLQRYAVRPEELISATAGRKDNGRDGRDIVRRQAVPESPDNLLLPGGTEAVLEVEVEGVTGLAESRLTPVCVVVVELQA